MKTIYLAVSFNSENSPTTEEFIKNATEQISFKYDAENFTIKPADTGSIAQKVLPAEAIFAILSVLSTQSEKVTLSKSKYPERAMELAKQLIEANGWSAPRDGWEALIEFPSIVEEINNKKREMVGRLFQQPKSPVTKEAAQAPLNFDSSNVPADFNPAIHGAQPSALDTALSSMTEEEAAQAAKEMSAAAGHIQDPGSELPGHHLDPENPAKEAADEKDPFSE